MTVLTRLATAIRVFRLLGKGGSIIERKPREAAKSRAAVDDMIRHLRNRNLTRPGRDAEPTNGRGASSQLMPGDFA